MEGRRDVSSSSGGGKGASKERMGNVRRMWVCDPSLGCLGSDEVPGADGCVVVCAMPGTDVGYCPMRLLQTVRY